jgi:amino acid permease
MQSYHELGNKVLSSISTINMSNLMLEFVLMTKKEGVFYRAQGGMWYSRYSLVLRVSFVTNELYESVTSAERCTEIFFTVYKRHPPYNLSYKFSYFSKTKYKMATDVVSYTERYLQPDSLKQFSPYFAASVEMQR